jgi:hypothetical protein
MGGRPACIAKKLFAATPVVKLGDAPFGAHLPETTVC